MKPGPTHLDNGIEHVVRQQQLGAGGEGGGRGGGGGGWLVGKGAAEVADDEAQFAWVGVEKEEEEEEE